MPSLWWNWRLAWIREIRGVYAVCGKRNSTLLNNFRPPLFHRRVRCVKPNTFARAEAALRPEWSLRLPTRLKWPGCIRSTTLTRKFSRRVKCTHQMPSWPGCDTAQKVMQQTTRQLPVNSDSRCTQPLRTFLSNNISCLYLSLTITFNS